MTTDQSRKKIFLNDLTHKFFMLKKKKVKNFRQGNN